MVLLTYSTLVTLSRNETRQYLQLHDAIVGAYVQNLATELVG
jgi:hypothetical protein